MKVETFECTETAAEPIEASEEAVSLIESLGLEGQRSLVCPNEDAGRDTRCPYREMTTEEQFVYGLLCPKKFELAKYAASPIPLRVLQVASHANSLGFFDEVQVWDKENVLDLDPVLVGVKHKDGQSWNRVYYILARWGEELETFAVLMKRMVQRKRDQICGQLDQLKSQVDAEKSSILGLTDAKLISAGADSDIKIEKPYAWRS